MKKLYNTVKNIVKTLFFISIFLFVLYMVDDYFKLFDIIKIEQLSEDSTRKNESNIIEIKKIDEYGCLSVDVDNNLDTTWVSVETKYLDLSIFNVDKKIKLYEKKIISTYKSKSVYRVKIGYKDLVYYKKDDTFILDAGKTTILSVEKISDEVIEESGVTLKVEDIKRLETQSLELAKSNAFTQSNIITAKRNLKTKTIDMFKQYDDNINTSKIQINVK